MPFFRATKSGITVKFDRTDARLLASLATQLVEVLEGRADAGDDPALVRLFPDAYRDSAEDAAEFRRFTETELADDKIRSALGMVDLLTPADDSAKQVHVVLDPAAAFDWMRSFTDIRLAIAARLEIVDEDSPVVFDAETRYTRAVYNWLGGLQWSLVRAIDK